MVNKYKEKAVKITKSLCSKDLADIVIHNGHNDGIKEKAIPIIKEIDRILEQTEVK